jgi:hypothetical protein
MRMLPGLRNSMFLVTNIREETLTVSILLLLHLFIYFCKKSGPKMISMRSILVLSNALNSCHRISSNYEMCAFPYCTEGQRVLHSKSHRTSSHCLPFVRLKFIADGVIFQTAESIPLSVGSWSLGNRSM